MEYVKLSVDGTAGRGALDSNVCASVERRESRGCCGVFRCVLIDEETNEDVHDDKMATAFCKSVANHLAGERKDMDVAVFGGAQGYNFVGFLIVRCVAIAGTLSGRTVCVLLLTVPLIVFWSNIAA